VSLLYKPDWDQTKERSLAWWAGEAIGRCALVVTAPKAGLPAQEPPRLPDRVENRWLDFDYLHASNEYRMSRTFYGGEALPVWYPGYPGWDFIPAYLGCRVELAETTGWVYPLIEGGRLTDYDYRDFVIRPDNRWWQFALKMHRFAAEEARGKSLAGIQAIGGSGDILARLRGDQQLAIDCAECPAYVREFDQHLMRIWQEVFETFYQIIKDVTEGCTNFMHLWSPGRFYIPHNDFSYMISPRMFREIFLPGIEWQVEYLDHSLYHVDGVGSFNHVDALCGIRKLQAIQILPGAGKPSPLYYMDVLKKVQAAGKNLQIYLEPGEVETALENLSARGLLIITACETEEEAKDLLKKAEHWSKDRKV
jgi:hypothetical protein